MPISLDKNHRAFKERLQRLDRLHRQGRSFHTSDTYVRPTPPTLLQRLRYRLLRSLRLALLVVVVGWVLKGVLLYAVGPEVYLERLAGLTATNTEFDRAAAWLMTLDGATQYLAEFFAELFPTHS